MARRRYQAQAFDTVFVPTQVTAVSAWLRLANATSDGNGYSSIPDVLNATSPAAQNDNDRKPATGTSSNGFPIAVFDSAGDVLSWPLAAANNGTSITGYMTRIRPTSVTAVSYTIIAISIGTSGASARKLVLETVNNTIRVRISIDASNIRQALTGAVLTAGAYTTVGLEYNGGNTLEADECVITIDGVAVALTFANNAGTPNDMPDTLVSVTGNALIGGFSNEDAGTNQFVGDMGPNFYSFGSAMSGVTSGLLTPAARLSLHNFERAA